jgi:hypothetical protein
MVWAILNPDQNAALKELIQGQKSDRVVAVVGGAILDNSLRLALEQRLRPKNGKTDINEQLFRPAGPLGNLQPKIQLAYQLYMFEKPVRNAMTGLAQIRNLFAHHLDMRFSSDHPEMKKAVAQLRLQEGRTHYPSAFGGDTKYRLEIIHQTRDLFFVNLKLVLICLMADADKHLPWSNSPMNIKQRAAPEPRAESAP